MNKEDFLSFCQNYRCDDALMRPPLVMGIINLTPDSFSQDGLYLSEAHAFDKAMTLIHEGAHLLDLGGESSRPGSKPISLQEELDRVLPLIERLRGETDTCLSIDTTKPEVMMEAARLGVGLINDVHALQAEGAIEAASRLNIPICLMHRQGLSETMQDAPFYPDGLLETIHTFFQKRIDACVEAGIPRNLLILDPGFGFGKTAEGNLQLIQQWSQFHQHERPMMLGVSRKQTIGTLLKKPVHERLIGGLVLTIMAASKRLSIVRTHDVDATRQAIEMLEFLTTGKIND